MHDLDQTLQLQDSEYLGGFEEGPFGNDTVGGDTFDDGEFSDDEFGLELEGESLAGGPPVGSADSEFEADDEDDFDDGELEFESSGMPFTEEEELELASELLMLETDEELDFFFRKVFRRVRKRFRNVGKRLRRIAKPLGRVLRPVAKRLLPIAGRAVGTFFGGPIGGAIGGRAAALAGRAFGLELEGLDPEDRELEVARRVVRLAGAAAVAGTRLPTRVPAGQAARLALKTAARRHAPGLIRHGKTHRSKARVGRSGHWKRLGSRIVLFGV